MMKINLKENSIVVFVGAMATGKSTFAKKHFNNHDIVSSDFIREQLTGDFEEQGCSKTAFEILYATVEARAKARMFTIVDSTGGQYVIDNIKTIGKKHDRDLVIIKFPHLEEHQITEERMQHRMRYISAYYNQVKRIDSSVFPKDYRLYEIDSIDDVDISFENTGKNYELDDSFDYVVIPDLHGCHHILEHYIKKYGENENVKFVILGDIVDRGPSSCRTFYLVNELVKSGKGFYVVGNHCNKFMRYLKKWRVDTNQDKFLSLSEFDDIPTYGMKISHGFDITLREFYDHLNMVEYAEDFIEFYNNAPEYLKLENDNEIHFFAHAGISRGIAKGMPVGKFDISTVLYKAIPDIMDVVNMFDYIPEKNVTVHVGHINHDEINITTEGNRRIINHDIGCGKVKIEGIPEFHTITNFNG